MSDNQRHGGFESHISAKAENHGISQASQEGWNFNRTGQSQTQSTIERGSLLHGQQQQQHGCIEFTNPYPQEALRANQANHNSRGNFGSYMNGMSGGHQQHAEQQRPAVQTQQQQEQHRPHTGGFGSYDGRMAAPKVENITIQRGVHNLLQNNWGFQSHIRDGK